MTRRQAIARALANAERHLGFAQYAHMINGDVRIPLTELEASVARLRVAVDRVPIPTGQTQDMSDDGHSPGRVEP